MKECDLSRVNLKLRVTWQMKCRRILDLKVSSNNLVLDLKHGRVHSSHRNNTHIVCMGQVDGVPCKGIGLDHQGNSTYKQLQSQAICLSLHTLSLPHSLILYSCIAHTNTHPSTLY